MAREEEEKRLAAEEAKRVLEEKKRVIEERKAEQRENKSMKLEDFDAPEPVKIEIVEEIPEPEPEIIPEPVEEEPKYDLDNMTKQQILEMRMRQVIAAYKSNSEGNKNHPRKQEVGKFFMPFLFGDDITFDPFESSKFVERSTDIDENNSVTDKNVDNIVGFSGGTEFADLKEKIYKYKKFMKLQKSLALYGTSDKSTHPEDWTELILADGIDWKQYFRQQKELFREPEPIVITPRPSDEEIFYDRMRENLSQKLATEEPSIEDYLFSPSVKSLIPPENLGITPLPIGKVESAEALPLTYVYYQVRFQNPTSTLTIEVECKFGQGNLYVAQGFLPTENHHTYRSLSTDGLGKALRIVIPGSGGDLKENSGGSTGTSQEEDSVFLVAVYGLDQGVAFNIWAMATVNNHVPSNPLIKTSEYILALEDIISHDPDQLDNYFQLVYKNAHKKAVETMNAAPKPFFQIMNSETGGTILSNSNNVSSDENLPPAVASDVEEPTDAELLENFVLRSGTFVTKSEIEKRQSSIENSSNTKYNPNFDKSFFLPAEIITRESMLEYLDPAIYDKKEFSNDFDFQGNNELVEETDKNFDFWMKTWNGSPKKKNPVPSIQHSYSLPQITANNKAKTNIELLNQTNKDDTLFLPKFSQDKLNPLKSSIPKQKNKSKDMKIYSSTPIPLPKYSLKSTVTRKDYKV